MMTCGVCWLVVVAVMYNNGDAGGDDDDDDDVKHDSDDAADKDDWREREHDGRRMSVNNGHLIQSKQQQHQ